MSKHLRMFLGFAALLVGIVLALPLVPGPGIVFILLGLVLLSDHFTWAKRLLDWAKRKGQSVHPK
jgi:Putative transmembrane protein (PGPGW)